MQRSSYFDVKVAWAGLGWTTGLGWAAWAGLAWAGLAGLDDTVTGYSGMSPVYTAHCAAHSTHILLTHHLPGTLLTALDTGPVQPINQLHHVRNPM